MSRNRRGVTPLNKGQIQEALVTLYLRLNGYLTSGFIVHSPIHGRNHTEVDIIGVRFPHNAEPVRGVGTDEELGASNEVVDFVIGEVKSRGKRLRFNEALRSSREAVDSVLQWCGYFTPAERPALTDELLAILEKGRGVDGINLGSLPVRRFLLTFGAVFDQPCLEMLAQRRTTLELGVANFSQSLGTSRIQIDTLLVACRICSITWASSATNVMR